MFQICVVNEQLEVVYHSLVQPEKQIVNYLTRYSGITDKLLENVQTRYSTECSTIMQYSTVQ